MAGDRTAQTLTLRDGRQLGYAEYGEPEGCAVFYFHGACSSRLEHPADEDLLPAVGVRLITTDRPGHGLSTFQPGRRLLDWPGDVSQLADHLGLDGFYVMGHSSGGPHALACAYRLPDRVLAGAAVSSVAPMGRPGAFKGMPVPNQALAGSARWVPWLTKLVRRIMRRMIMGDAEKAARQLMASIPEADKEILYTPENISAFVDHVREGLGPGWQGAAQDDVVINQDWGFNVADIRVRIDIWHGDADVNVPCHAGQYLHDTIPHSRATLLPGEGHFLTFKHWAEILAALISGN